MRPSKMIPIPNKMDEMMLDLVLWPDKRLRQKCIKVPQEAFGSNELTKQIADMIYTMAAYNGIGLAANQVGFDNRVIIVAKNPEKLDGLPLIMVNPKIVRKSDSKQTMREGCLSFPGQTAIRRRSKTISLTAQDMYGTIYTWHSKGLQGQCIQHEIDHLNGKTFLDK